MNRTAFVLVFPVLAAAYLAASCSSSGGAVVCGHPGEACCAGDVCAHGSACMAGTCTSPGTGGAVGTGGRSTGGSGTGGAGTGATSPDGGMCGGMGQACCNGTQCSGSLSCRSGTCQNVPADGTGTPCTKNSDCPSGICQPVGSGNVCTTSCNTTADCVPGWTCGAELGQSGSVCQCMASAEACDGKDNDCNGVVDDEPAVDQGCAQQMGTGYTCDHGACTCAHMCGGNCVDTLNDPNNCGACGNACAPFVEACHAGTCGCLGGQATCDVATILSSPMGLTGGDLVVDATNVYCSYQSSVMKAPLSGGAVTTLATAPAYYVNSVAVSPTDVFYSTTPGDTVWSVPIGGGTVSTAAYVPNAYDEHIAINSTNVYFTARLVGKVETVPLGGGTPVTLASGQNNPAAIAIDATNVYWVNIGDNTVMQMPLSGGTPSTIFSGDTPKAIAADGTSVYWTTSTAVMKAPAGGGAPVTLASMASPTATSGGLVVDGTSVYWASISNYILTVWKIPAGGGTPVPLVWGANVGIGAFTVDGTSFYWEDTLAGNVMKLTPK